MPPTEVDLAAPLLFQVIAINDIVVTFNVFFLFLLDYNKDSSKSPNSSREVSVEREKAPPTVVSEKPTHNGTVLLSADTSSAVKKISLSSKTDTAI